MTGHTDEQGRRTGPCIIGINFTGRAGDSEALERLRKRHGLPSKHNGLRIVGMTNDQAMTKVMLVNLNNGRRKISRVDMESGWTGIYAG